METSWFGIPGATRKVNKLADMYQKSLVSHVKGLLGWAGWTDTFDYNVGSRGFSDNCTALGSVRGWNRYLCYLCIIHFSTLQQSQLCSIKPQAGLIIPCV